VRNCCKKCGEIIDGTHLIQLRGYDCQVFEATAQLEITAQVFFYLTFSPAEKPQFWGVPSNVIYSFFLGIK
jgi:hypothetical protein